MREQEDIFQIYTTKFVENVYILSSTYTNTQTHTPTHSTNLHSFVVLVGFCVVSNGATLVEFNLISTYKSCCQPTNQPTSQRISVPANSINSHTHTHIYSNIFIVFFLEIYNIACAEIKIHFCIDIALSKRK